MNKNTIQYALISLIFIIVNSFKILAGEPIPKQILTFKTPSEKVMLAEKHLYVFNGSTSVGLVPDHLGFHRIVAPPFFAFPFNADLQLFGQGVKVNRFDWYPSECVFEGEKIMGVESAMQVVPVKSRRGVLVKLTLKNLNAKGINIPFDWVFSGSPGKSLNWEFSAETRSLLTNPREAPTTLDTDGNVLSMVKLETRLTASLFGAEGKVQNNSIGGVLKLQKGETKTLSLLVLIDQKEKLSISAAKSFMVNEESLIEETRSYWTNLIDSIGGRLPQLKGASPELQAFYNTGLMSFLSTRFEVPEFLFNPYYATSGVDGGATNAYLWDFSYNSFTTALLDKAVMRNQILQFFKVNIDECYAYDPVYGKAQGPRYSYNYYNMARLMYNYLTITGDSSILNELIDGKTALTSLYEACLGFENMDKEPDLMDYGNNHNLLELKKTEDYTHVTPSPNGERVLTYKYLTEIYKMMDQKTPHDLIQRGEVLKEKFIQKLWNPDALWLNTLDEKGKPRIAYSIQIFDVIRTGMLNMEQEKGILTHLKEGEFLSAWGVHSLAVTDPGYDPRDVDWGGPGAYTGDPTELITDLCQAGYANSGVDLLKRILWWGELPYLPQAMRANEKGYREDGRANLISGGINCQAIISGLFGVSFELNKIKIKPINHSIMKGLSLTDLNVRGHTFNIQISENTFTVTINDKEIIKPLGEEVIFNFKKDIEDKLVVFTFDDATASQYSVVAPLLKQYGFGATFFVCEFQPNFSDSAKYMNWRQIKELDKMGFEIANHTRTHPNVGKLPKEKFIEELNYIENKFDSLDIPHSNAFAYPGYGISRSAINTLQDKGYVFARIGGDRAYDPKVDHPLLIPSWAMNSENKNEIMKAFDEAKDGKIVVLTIHGVPDIEHPWVNTPPELFEEYLRYLSENNFKVISIRDLENYIDIESAMKLGVPNLNDL